MIPNGPSNCYWDQFDAGIYVDVGPVSRFFLKDKLDSGFRCRFSRPISPGHKIYKEDSSLVMTRDEVTVVEIHLGHVFTDGPKEKVKAAIASIVCLLLHSQSRNERKGLLKWRTKKTNHDSPKLSR